MKKIIPFQAALMSLVFAVPALHAMPQPKGANWFAPITADQHVMGVAFTPSFDGTNWRYNQIVQGRVSHSTIGSTETGVPAFGGLVTPFTLRLDGGRADALTLTSGGHVEMQNGSTAEGITLSGKSMLTINNSTVNNIHAQGLRAGEALKKPDGSIDYNAQNYPKITLANGGATASNITLDGVSRLDVYGNEADNPSYVNNLHIGQNALSMVSGNAQLDGVVVEGLFRNFLNGGHYTGPMAVMKNVHLKAGSDSRIYGDGTLVNPRVDANAFLQLRDGELQGAVIGGRVDVVNNDDGSGTQTLSGLIDIIDTGQLRLSEGANYTLTAATFNLGGTLETQQATSLSRLNMAGGTVLFSGQPFYQNRIETLSGHGQFVMRSAIADKMSDFLHIAEGSGRFGILMQDSGLSPNSDYDLNIAHVERGDAAFNLTNPGGLVDLGTYKYTLTQNGQNWSLTPTHWLSTGAEAVVDVIDGNSRMALGNIERIQSRFTLPYSIALPYSIGLRRFTDNAHRVWLDYDYSTQRSKSGYRLHNNTATLGFDHATALENDRLNIIGAYAGYNRARLSFTDQSGDNQANQWHIGLYDTFRQGPLWVSGIAQYSQQRNDLQVNTATQTSSGSFTYHHYTLALSTGVDLTYNAFSLTPYGGLTASRGMANGFSLSSGLQTAPDNRTQLLAHVGLMTGSTWALQQWDVTPFADVRLNAELVDTSSVVINGDALHSTHNDVGIQADVGVRVAHGNTSAFIKGGYGYSGEFTEPLNITLGVDYRF